MLSSNPKRCFNLLFAALLAFHSSVTAKPVSSISTEGRASAQVIKPISVRSERNLDFGWIQSGIAAVKTVEPQELEQSGGSSAAKFQVLGDPLRSYRIEIDPNVVARGENFGAEIEVRDLKSYSQVRNTIGEMGSLDYVGRDTIYVGGTIELGDRVPDDTYFADVLVSVYYD